MTTLADDLLSWPALPQLDSPAILPRWVLPDYTGHIARYGEAIWPLEPLIGNPSADRASIDWDEFPASMREDFRLIAWTMINGELTRSFLRDRPPAWRAHVSAGTFYSTVWWWRTLAQWLVKRGATALSMVSPHLLAEFALSFKDKGRSRNHVNALLRALTRLWAFDQMSVQPTGVCEPPWEREGVDDYLPAATTRGENDTDPVPEQTMGPLLIWAMRVVDDFADDILAAWAERQRLWTAARQQPATRESLAALRAFVEPLIAEGRPVPTTIVRGRVALAASYVAGSAGASVAQVHKFSQRLGDYPQQHPGPCPLGVALTGTIGGRAWRTSIGYDEAADLMRVLATACFIVIAYLTGMRPGEVLGLRSGCCPDPEDGGRHLIRGNIYKTARDEDGFHLSAGTLREVPWVAIKPVVNAIRVLERFVPDGALLFDQKAHDLIQGRVSTGSLNPSTMRRKVEGFVAWANAEAVRLDCPNEIIPPDPHGNIGLARFRRTLAWHIARRPGGLVALAVQYGHLRTSVSVGYASRSRDGIHELLDVETARATIDTVADLHADLQAGSGVSGPAARRAINAAAQAPRFEGVIIQADTAVKVLANPDLAVHDNPLALVMCVYKREKALCHREGTKDTPALDHCVSTCANIARTDRQADQLHQRADHLEDKAQYVPEELANRLLANAAKLRETADRHHENRITLKETDW